MSAETIRTTMSVPAIRCSGCAETIGETLGPIDGVDAVDVDVHAKTVTVNHAPRITRERLAAALGDAGFPVA